MLESIGLVRHEPGNKKWHRGIVYDALYQADIGDVLVYITEKVNCYLACNTEHDEAKFSCEVPIPNFHALVNMLQYGYLPYVHSTTPSQLHFTAPIVGEFKINTDRFADDYHAIERKMQQISELGGEFEVDGTYQWIGIDDDEDLVYIAISKDENDLQVEFYVPLKDINKPLSYFENINSENGWDEDEEYEEDDDEYEDDFFTPRSGDDLPF